MRSIKDVLENDFGLDLTGWSLTNVIAISADGSTIVGSGTNPTGCIEAWIATIPEPAEDTIYVDADATGANDGSSWPDAYNYLQDALGAAKAYDEIRVAGGTYRPDANSSEPGGSGDRNATFQLVTGAAFKGGYAGYGSPDPDARDITANETILSGDIGTPNDKTDNSYKVVTGATAVLDGFTITGGNDRRSNSRAGGLYIDWGDLLKVANCTFCGNSACYGGGMYSGNLANSTITNCTFSENSSYSGFGGGLFNGVALSHTKLINCTFTGNSTDAFYFGGYGGGMSNGGATHMGVLTILINCTFSGNSARFGGGMYNGGGNPTLTNCTFSDNSAGTCGGALYSGGSTRTFTNCILWGNMAPTDPQTNAPSVITYSDVEGGWPGVGNRDVDPCFVDVAGGDLRLMFGSPCIDTGNNNAPNLPSTDLAGNPRVVDGNYDGSRRVDMGALEYGVFAVPYLQDWEAGIDGWHSKYQPYYGPGYDPILIVSDPDPPYTNVQSVVRVDAATNYLSPLIKVIPGESYAVSAWINWVSGGWPFVGISRYDADQNPIGLPMYDPGTTPRLIWLIGKDGYHTTEGYVPVTDVVTPVPIVDGWNWYEKAFTVPEGTAYIRLTTELFKHPDYNRGGDHPLGYFDDIAIDVAPASAVTFQAGDLDGDCDVDFVDFALIVSAAASKHDSASAAGVSTKNGTELRGLNVLAHNWLAGKD